MTNNQLAITELEHLPSDDPEAAHWEADKIVLEFLTEIGHGDVAKAWQRAASTWILVRLML